MSIGRSLDSNNPIERLNDETSGAPDVVDISPNGEAMVRLVGASARKKDQWAAQRARDMTLESIGQLSGGLLISLAAVVR